ncbi:MAG: uracil-DNA glycosylase [Candidatus Eisenbacteria bacterium]|uniref:Uracil-DNA glycosylase n=1 Tax=Eiseniibacteriota bacterium TaxID=2212470 RepID=A0A948WDM2_UNCEI|nr:uracil-DNA glycosylase [Candidatus Eisenbacteria bacterium]MBU1948261.1 uracil-DNA glycosylase [Candidatus Eisenbacteria bacterium]MBU2691988.1 uracil-DNA glycosylase [Candidatus Eisenbacteria bacterium]
MINQPKSLGDKKHREERLAQIHQPHVAKLNAFVETIRRQQNCGRNVPYFDPADGGVNAECLFLLEAPGPKAVESGFVSRNNPDETAKNWLLLNAEAGIDRSRTVSWNIVPWYIGDGPRIRPANRDDIEQGWPWLVRLLEPPALLPRLRIVVLVGRKAQRVAERIRQIRHNLVLMTCPHPSPVFVNRRRENRGMVLEALWEVSEKLG